MKNMNELLEIMQTLRDPRKGCPWDKEQDFSSIVPYTIEEAYEVADAIQNQDMDGLCNELGDLLFQVVYHAQMAAEKDLFTFSDVIDQINRKLIERHPHVFADATVNDAEEQSREWEKLKAQERASQVSEKENSLLARIGLNLPALTRAQKIQARAAMVGFDWSNVMEVKDKIMEELNELEEAISEKNNRLNVQEEIGDLLFSCVNFSRHLNIDAESALRAANHKFCKRFLYIEEQLRHQNKAPEQVSMEEMERLWQESKQYDQSDS